MNNLKKIALAALTVAAVAAPTLSQAENGTITFDGELTANTCTVKSDGVGPNFTVTLPKLSTSALATAGTRAGIKKFPLSLTLCNPQTGNVAFYFEPLMATTDIASGRLVNTGTATNVQVEMLNNQQTVMNLGAGTTALQNSQAIAIVGGTGSTDYYARYYATGATTGGTVKASVQYSMSWQ